MGGRVSRNHQGEVNSVSQAGVDPDIAPACVLCVRGCLWKVKMASASIFFWQKAAPQLLPWRQTIQFISICLWCLLSCCPNAGAQREWVWVNPWVGLFKRGFLGFQKPSYSLSHNPCWFLQPEFMGTSLPVTGSQSLETWYETLHSWGPPQSRHRSQFWPITCGCGTNLFYISKSGDIEQS